MVRHVGLHHGRSDFPSGLSIHRIQPGGVQAAGASGLESAKRRNRRHAEGLERRVAAGRRESLSGGADLQQREVRQRVQERHPHARRENYRRRDEGHSHVAHRRRPVLLPRDARCPGTRTRSRRTAGRRSRRRRWHWRSRRSRRWASGRRHGARTGASHATRDCGATTCESRESADGCVRAGWLQ